MTEERLDAAFAALADPTRRAIVSRLARGDATVANWPLLRHVVAGDLQASQGARAQRPHLAARDAQFRPCHLEVEALDGALDWIGTNRRLWDERFDKLDVLLADIQRRPAATASRRGKGRAVDEHGGATAADDFRFTRVFDAPRELVFRCMTDPGHLTHFWGPKGVSAPRHRIAVDARPGGVFETVMVNDADGSEHGPGQSTTRCARPSCCRGPSRTPACR